MIQELPEDESILSGYLDNQLGPDLRQGVESRLVANPQDADTLRRIGEARQLVASLPRPKMDDLSGDVLRQIERQQSARDRNRRIAEIVGLARSPQIWAGVGLVAASLLIALIPLFSHLQPTPMAAHNPATAPELASKIGGQPSRIVDSAKKPESVSTGDPVVSVQGVLKDSPAVTVQPAAVRTATNGSTDPHSRVHQLLDNPNLRHVFLVADKIGGTAHQEVSDLIEKSARTEFYSITVAQGIVLDPDHPSEAKVFAFTIDDSELDRVRARLNAAFGDRNQEIDPRPEIVTQLADIGQVLAYSPPAVGEFVIPHADVALKSKAPDKGVHLVDGSFPGSQGFDRGAENSRQGKSNSKRKNRGYLADRSAGLTDPTNEPSKTAQTTDDVGQDLDPRHEGPEKPSKESVVLIWITSPAPG